MAVSIVANVTLVAFVDEVQMSLCGWSRRNRLEVRQLFCHVLEGGHEATEKVEDDRNDKEWDRIGDSGQILDEVTE